MARRGHQPRGVQHAPHLPRGHPVQPRQLDLLVADLRQRGEGAVRGRRPSPNAPCRAAPRWRWAPADRRAGRPATPLPCRSSRYVTVLRGSADILDSHPSAPHSQPRPGTPPAPRPPREARPGSSAGRWNSPPLPERGASPSTVSQPSACYRPPSVRASLYVSRVYRSLILTRCTVPDSCSWLGQ